MVIREVEMEKLFTVEVERSGGIHACLWPSDLVRIVVNLASIDEGEVV